jgi:hypothetical protein
MTADQIMEYIAEYQKHSLYNTGLTLYQYILLREGIKGDK